MIDTEMQEALDALHEAIRLSEAYNIDGVRIRLHRAKNYLIDAMRAYEDQRRARDAQE